MRMMKKKTLVRRLKAVEERQELLRLDTRRWIAHELGTRWETMTDALDRVHTKAIDALDTRLSDQARLMGSLAGQMDALARRLDAYEDALRLIAERGTVAETHLSELEQQVLELNRPTFFDKLAEAALLREERQRREEEQIEEKMHPSNPRFAVVEGDGEG